MLQKYARPKCKADAVVCHTHIRIFLKTYCFNYSLILFVNITSSALPKIYENDLPHKLTDTLIDIGLVITNNLLKHFTSLFLLFANNCQYNVMNDRITLMIMSFYN